MSEDRVYYRSATDGEKGYVVSRDGADYIKLDRPNEEVLRRFNDGVGWIPDTERRPISRSQLAQICYAADRELCKAIGMHGQVQKAWLDLSDKQRIAWMEKGPLLTPERKALWSAVMMVLEPLSR